MHNRRERGKKEREKGETEGVCTAYQFCRAEEILRGPVILFPDSTLEEGERSGVGGRERGREKSNIKAIATSAYVASSILSSQNVMEK